MRELIYSFNGGEISPLLAGRADLPGIRRMARIMRGFLGHPTGAAMRRPSLLFVSVAGTGGSALIPFNAGTGSRYVLELFESSLRVWTDAGVLQTTIAAPWTADQIAAVQFVQSNDVMWLTHPLVPVQELQHAAGGWTLTEMPWEWPPLRDENISAITITPTLVTPATVPPSVDLVASGPIFDASQVGGYWQISHFRDVASADLTVNAAAPAFATYSITAIPNDGDTVTIGPITYTWRATGAAPYDITIQTTEKLTRDVLTLAVTPGSSPSTDVFPGTLAHPTVTALTDGQSDGATSATAVLSINVAPVGGVAYTNLFPTSTVSVINGGVTTTLTAVAAGAGAGQFNLGADQEGTLDNIITAFNLLSGTTGGSFAARNGRSTVFTATTPGTAGEAILVARYSGNPPIQNWLLWTDATGVETAHLTAGTGATTYRMRVNAVELGEFTPPIPVSTSISAPDAYWNAAFLQGGSETDAVSNPVTIKGAWNFTTLGRWQGTVYIERQDAAGNWQIMREFIGKLDINRTAEGFSETATPFRIRVKDLAGAASSEIPNPRFILEAAETIVHGLVRLTAVTDSTHARADVISELQAYPATPNWREGAFSAYRGYPKAVTLHEERLIFAGVASEPQKVWGSGAGDFRDFEETGLADGSWQWPFTSAQAYPIQWMISSRGLVIGTAGNERVWESGEQGITPVNPPLQRQLTFNGSEPVMSVGAGEVVVFVQKGGRSIREYNYELASQSYIAPDLTQLVEHLMQTGIVSLAIQRNPFTVIWAVTGSGMLLACTYERRDEVVGWCPQNVDGTVSSVACVQGEVGVADAVWIVVTRNGLTSLERFDPTHWNRLAVIPMPAADRVWHLDAAVQAMNVAGVLSGLNHLEGQTVSILVEGVPQPQQVVVAGTITVAGALVGKMTVAGLPYTSEFQPAIFDSPTQSGTSVGKRYVAKRAHLRFYQTGDCQYRNDVGNTAYRIPFRFPADPTEQAAAIFNGLYDINVNGTYLDGIGIVIFTDSEQPLNILNLVPEFEIYGT